MLGNIPQHFRCPQQTFFCYFRVGALTLENSQRLIYRDISFRLQAGMTDSQNDRLWNRGGDRWPRRTGPPG
jgi:hypothetical protein